MYPESNQGPSKPKHNMEELPTTFILPLLSVQCSSSKRNDKCHSHYPYLQVFSFRSDNK